MLSQPIVQNKNRSRTFTTPLKQSSKGLNMDQLMKSIHKVEQDSASDSNSLVVKQNELQQIEKFNDSLERSVLSLSQHAARLESISAEETKRLHRLSTGLEKAKQAEEKATESIRQLNQIQHQGKEYRDRFAMETIMIKKKTSQVERALKKREDEERIRLQLIADGEKRCNDLRDLVAKTKINIEQIEGKIKSTELETLSQKSIENTLTVELEKKQSESSIRREVIEKTAEEIRSLWEEEKLLDNQMEKHNEKKLEYDQIKQKLEEFKGTIQQLETNENKCDINNINLVIELAERVLRETQVPDPSFEHSLSTLKHNTARRVEIHHQITCLDSNITIKKKELTKSNEVVQQQDSELAQLKDSLYNRMTIIRKVENDNRLEKLKLDQAEKEFTLHQETLLEKGALLEKEKEAVFELKKRIDQEIQDIKNHRKEIDLTISRMCLDIDNLKKEQSAHESELKELEIMLETKKKEYDECSLREADLQVILKENNETGDKHLAELRKRISDTKITLDRTREREMELSGTVQTLEKRLEAQQKELEQKVSQFELMFSEAEFKLKKDIEQEDQARKQQEKSLRRKIEETKSNLFNLDKEKRSLEDLHQRELETLNADISEKKKQIQLEINSLEKYFSEIQNLSYEQMVALTPIRLSTKGVPLSPKTPKKSHAQHSASVYSLDFAETDSGEDLFNSPEKKDQNKDYSFEDQLSDIFSDDFC